MTLAPLSQWICDTCETIIEKPEDGWIEWQHSGPKDYSVSNFRICHHKTKSPLDGPEGCYRHHERRNDSHLQEFLGPGGLVRMLSKVDVGSILDPKGRTVGKVEDFRNWTEVCRRLFIPYYEEARQHFDEARKDGFFDEMNEVAVYSEENLKALIRKFG